MEKQRKELAKIIVGGEKENKEQKKQSTAFISCGKKKPKKFSKQ